MENKVQQLDMENKVQQLDMQQLDMEGDFSVGENLDVNNYDVDMKERVVTGANFENVNKS